MGKKIEKSYPEYDRLKELYDTGFGIYDHTWFLGYSSGYTPFKYDAKRIAGNTYKDIDSGLMSDMVALLERGTKLYEIVCRSSFNNGIYGLWKKVVGGTSENTFKHWFRYHEYPKFIDHKHYKFANLLMSIFVLNNYMKVSLLGCPYNIGSNHQIPIKMLKHLKTIDYDEHARMQFHFDMKLYDLMTSDMIHWHDTINSKVMFHDANSVDDYCNHTIAFDMANELFKNDRWNAKGPTKNGVVNFMKDNKFSIKTVYALKQYCEDKLINIHDYSTAQLTKILKQEQVPTPEYIRLLYSKE